MDDTGWINIEERLPEKDVRVLVYYGENVFIATLDYALATPIEIQSGEIKREACVWYEDGIFGGPAFPLEKAKWWMPLPNPPKEDKNALPIL